MGQDISPVDSRLGLIERSAAARRVDGPRAASERGRSPSGDRVELSGPHADSGVPPLGLQVERFELRLSPERLRALVSGDESDGAGAPRVPEEGVL
jgi:hypothetical protein